MNAVAMAEGRKRAQAHRLRVMIRKVHAWEAWNRAGADFRTEPERPKDSDFRAARKAGA